MVPRITTEIATPGRLAVTAYMIMVLWRTDPETWFLRGDCANSVFAGSMLSELRERHLNRTDVVHASHVQAERWKGNPPRMPRPLEWMHTRTLRVISALYASQTALAALTVNKTENLSRY